jgi:alkanesulfonate monooxygenase SsuD/methylene tetrahydromethanopterin reductase-like flavin-dependent oxidoreductase (luciferase family)
MRLTLSIPSFGIFFPAGRLHEVIDLARGAEAAGVDTVIVPDHVVMSENTGTYEWGPFPFPIDVPWLEPLTVFAAIAGATSRGRLDLGATLAGAHELAVAGATDVQLPMLAFVRRPEQLDTFFGELAERWAGMQAGKGAS